MTTDVLEPVGQEHANGGEPPLPALEVAGTQLTLPNLGGKSPTSATLKLTGGKVTLAAGTAFKKGETVELRIIATVNFVGQKDAHDVQTGQVVSAEQRHEARITDIQIVPQ